MVAGDLGQPLLEPEVRRLRGVLSGNLSRSKLQGAVDCSGASQALGGWELFPDISISACLQCVPGSPQPREVLISLQDWAVRLPWA